jgi:2-polyprenyl-3-methyl-5-hydroxy-6-metoxy-1,4-benzoquinol methylase
MAQHNNPKSGVTAKEIQANYFSQLARQRGTNEADNVDKFGEIVQLLKPSQTHPRVLECGAGTGLYTRHLLQLGYKVTAVDLSADALSVNRANAEAAGLGAALHTLEGDFVEIANALADEFDQVIFIKVLHHFSDLHHIQAALGAAAVRIGINGQVILFEPNGRNPLWRLYYSMVKDRVTGRSKWHYEKNTALIREHNLRQRLPPGVDAVFRYHYVIPAFVVARTGRFRPAMERLNAWLGRGGLARWSANLSCTLTRTS